MEKSNAILGLILIILTLGSVASLVHAENGPQEYDYTVKAEQVNDADFETENVTQVQNLNRAKQQALYNAFKKSDHFLGGSEATVTVDEKLSSNSRWQVVSINGVEVLVAFQFEGERPKRGYAIGLFTLFSLLAIVTASVLFYRNA